MFIFQPETARFEPASCLNQGSEFSGGSGNVEVVLHVFAGGGAESGDFVLVVEQFAHEVLGVADRAAIMVHGRITRTGAPEEIAEELAAAYLAGAGGD